MAERSFRREVEKLRLGDGEVFHGEGILAVTKALLQSGVSYVAGYQGAPISHLMDVLADANDILRELGVRFEHSASEATAAATLAASVHYPLRGAVTFKSTVGTNVASDALANLASGGVTGGAMLIVGEDYGEGSSIMQERSHAFAMKSQVWLLDPRPNLPKIVEMVERGFELSEASNTPVMLELRIRACHVHGRFRTKDNRRAAFSLKDAIEAPRRDTSRIVLPPASYVHEQEKISKRWPAAVRFVREHGLNETFDGEVGEIGIVLQGGMYNGVVRALELLGLADAFGRSRVPLHVLNVTYPLVDEDLVAFCRDKRAVLLVEEGQPDFIEQALNAILRRAGVATAVHGKDVLPMAGEYTGGVLTAGVARFVERTVPALLADRALPRSARPAAAPPAASQPVASQPVASQPVASPSSAPLSAPSSAPVVARIDPASISRPAPRGATALARAEAPPAGPLPTAAAAPAPASFAPAPASFAPAQAAASLVHPRPPSFCTGCPERPIFTAIKLLERELGPHHVSCDIGCHLFSILPPFEIGATTMGYGLGWAGAAALNTPETRRRTLSVMGDGGFWHNGLTSGVGNAVFNRTDNVLLIVDNGYSAATGGQDIPSSKADNPIRATNNPIERAVRGVGVDWVRTITRTYSVAQMRDTLREALTTPHAGPKVVIAQSECMLNRQRREKPRQRDAIARGERVVRERFGVDPDTCTGDHSCIRLSGCPSLTVRDNPDPLRADPVAAVVDSCVGCGLCGEVAHAAVLCPSFYRAGIVHNPDASDRRRDRWRRALIGWLQRRTERRLQGLAA